MKLEMQCQQSIKLLDSSGESTDDILYIGVEIKNNSALNVQAFDPKSQQQTLRLFFSSCPIQQC